MMAAIEGTGQPFATKILVNSASLCGVRRWGSKRRRCFQRFQRKAAVKRVILSAVSCGYYSPGTISTPRNSAGFPAKLLLHIDKTAGICQTAQQHTQSGDSILLNTVLIADDLGEI
jgi:hypothetical protein